MPVDEPVEDITIPTELRMFARQLCNLFYAGARRKKIIAKKPIYLHQIHTRWNNKNPRRPMSLSQVLQSIDYLKMANHNIKGNVVTGYYLEIKEE